MTNVPPTEETPTEPNWWPSDPPAPAPTYQPTPPAGPTYQPTYAPYYQQAPQQNVTVTVQAPQLPAMPRSKATAIVLVVLFNFWGLLYTYRTDGGRFWLHFWLSILTGGLWALLVSYPWVIIEACLRDEGYYGRYPFGS